MNNLYMLVSQGGGGGWLDRNNLLAFLKKYWSIRMTPNLLVPMATLADYNSANLLVLESMPEEDCRARSLALRLALWRSL